MRRWHLSWNLKVIGMLRLKKRIFQAERMGAFGKDKALLFKYSNMYLNMTKNIKVIHVEKDEWKDEWIFIFPYFSNKIWYIIYSVLGINVFVWRIFSYFQVNIGLILTKAAQEIPSKFTVISHLVVRLAFIQTESQRA